MSVARAAHPLWTSIQRHHLREWLRSSQNVDATIRKGERLDCPVQRCTRTIRREFLDGFVPKQPDRFLRQLRSRKLLGIHHCAHRQWVCHLLRLVASRIKKPSAVIVAETFGDSCLCQRCHYIQHPPQHRVICRWNLDSISARKQSRV